MCLQYDHIPNDNSATRYNGMVDAFRKTYRAEGVKGLYKVRNYTHSGLEISIRVELSTVVEGLYYMIEIDKNVEGAYLPAFRDCKSFKLNIRVELTTSII